MEIRPSNQCDWDDLEEKFPHSVYVGYDNVPDFNNEDNTEPFVWCRERFGLENYIHLSGDDYLVNPYAGWDCCNDSYYFRDPEHALLFKLTWGASNGASV